jgi:hypothetical protein
MVPKPPQVSLNGQLQATISGVSRGTDISLILFGVVCLIGALGCFWLSPITPWALAGAFGFLIGFGFVLSVWRKGIAARTQADIAPAQLTVKTPDAEVALSVPLDPENVIAKRLLSTMRTIIHARKPLPPPRGYVKNNPADGSSLHEYTDQERQALTNKWSAEVATHDNIVVEQLETAIRSVGSGATELREEPDEEKVPATGMPQLSKIQSNPVSNDQGQGGQKSLS